jgi:hypothetical protein
MWRWLRFLVALVAAVLVMLIVGTAWLLSGDRYQTLLTEHLSQALGAEVQVADSRLSYAGGLGIEFVEVKMQLPSHVSPVFSAERLAMLLDLKALIRGRISFHEMKVSRPHIDIIDDKGRKMWQLLGLLAATEKTSTPVDIPGWFTPTVAVRYVAIVDGSIAYAQKVHNSPFALSHVHVWLAHPENAGVVLQGSATLGQKGELGAIELRAVAPMWASQLDQWQVAWHGSVQLRNVVSHQLGRVLGHEWPHVTLSANLHYDGKGSGPIYVDGTVDARNLYAGAFRLRTAVANITQLEWQGGSTQTSFSTWREYLQAVSAEVDLDQVAGGISDESRQFILTKGTLTLREGALAVQGLSGTFGKKSHLRTGELSVPQFAAHADSEASATFEAEVNLQEDLDELLATFSKLGSTNLHVPLQKPRGQATITVSLYSPRFPNALTFDGEVALQRAGFRLPSMKPEVTDLSGQVRVTNTLIDIKAGTPLSLKVGDSRLQATGHVVDYLSTKPRVALHIESDLALADLPELEKGWTKSRNATTKTEEETLTQFVTNPQGRVQMQLDVQTSVPLGALRYKGTVTLQQAAMMLPKWNLTLNNLTGVMRVDRETLSSDEMTFTIDDAPVQLKGIVRDYLTPQRNGEGEVSFTGLKDAVIAPLLPLALVVPQTGTLDGKIDIRVPREGEGAFAGHVMLNNLLLDPLPKVFYPFGIGQGRLDWQGQDVNLTIMQGSSAGGAFTGTGRIISVSPVNLELALDFADLDLGAAFKLDQPKVEDPRPKNDTVQVRARLRAGQLRYKTFAAEQVQGLCYWHKRQADIQVTAAKTAGGSLTGDATLWPDSKDLYITPRVAGVDVPQLLSFLGTPSDKLTGTLNGDGKIYFPDWHEWKNLAQWRAHLSLAVADGMAQQVPVLVRLWSAVSLQELLSFQLPSLSSEGLAFSSLTGDFALGEGVAVTSNLTLASNAVRIEAAGEIDLAQHALDLKTSFMPLHGITSSVAKVPLAGQLLARGAELLTTLPFRVHGPYHDPTVTPLVVDLGQR